MMREGLKIIEGRKGRKKRKKKRKEIIFIDWKGGVGGGRRRKEVI